MGKIYLDTNTIKRVHFVKKDSLNPGYYSVPDFIIVGPQKTGTTWLADNLRLHPQVYFSREKELFFFNLLDRPEHPQYRSNDLGWYSNYFTISLLAYSKRLAKNAYKYRKWYFYKVAGEATASYAAMEDHLIEELVTICPQIKVIFSIRNPIQRAWSHAKMDLLLYKNKQLSDYSLEEFKRYYTSQYVLRCGFFTQNMKRWKSFLDEDQTKVVISERFRTEPVKHLKDVCRFLDISSCVEVINKDACFCMSNASPLKQPIPADHQDFLRTIYQEEIENLNKNYGTNYSL